MAKKVKDQHSFKVRSQAPSQQPPSSQHHTETHKDLRAARSYRFVINQGKTASSILTESSGPSVSSNPDAPGKQFVFAANKTTTAFTERIEENPCPPPPKRRKTKKYPHDDKLTINIRRPVKTYIPIDAWALIFKRCHPKFLVDARLVCRDFRDVLNTQSIWREARQYTFEALTTLGCPVELTEMQYANLLVGRGCQIKPCTRRDTRKIYWPFMLRMCETCLEQQVQCPERDSEEAQKYAEYRWELEPEMRGTIPEQLTSLLPAGNFWCKKWVEPRHLRLDRQMWAWESSNYCVMTRDYERLKADFEANVMTEPSNFLTWARTKWNATRDRTELAETLSGLHWDAILRRGSKRDEKEQFFVDKAEALRPPMRVAVLNKMAAYHSILENSNAPSLRSWDMLAKKIDKAELRMQAEQLVEWEQSSDMLQSILNSNDNEDEELLYDKLFKHRSTIQASGSMKLRRKNRVPEQAVILQIAQQELNNLLDVVHDEDVLLLLLNNVRKAYEMLETKPVGLNGDGSTGEYRLLLDDARMVVYEVLMPRSGHKGAARRKKLLGSLRCIGCTRHDANRMDTLEQLVVHICNTHAKYVGQDMHFWKWAIPVKTKFRRSRDQVAWYHIPWPRSMPALPAHRKATKDMVWDPDQEQEYIEHPVEENVDLFNELEASNNTEVAADDYTGNFCKAVRSLAATRLDSQGIMRLALEYATRREFQHQQHRASSIVLSPLKLKCLELATSRTSPDFEFKFECGLCLKDQRCDEEGRESHLSRNLNLLIAHWRYLHQIKEEDRLEDLISLPSHFELRRTIAELDAKLHAQKSRAEAKDKKLAPGSSDLLGKRDPRSAALLGIPSIRSRFDTLFVRRQPDREPTRNEPHEEIDSPAEEMVSEQEL